MKISLSITHDCNLRCRYCYAGKKFSRSMEMDTAKKIVDFAFMITPPNEQIDFSFFGGEPLLRRPFIEDVISYIHSKNGVNALSFNITTNGTLIDDAMIRFVRDNNVKLCISIDGPEHIHDRNRVDRHGRGSLSTILKNMEKISGKLDYFQVNSVYGPDTIAELDQTVRFLIANNIHNIHLNPDIVTTWGMESFAQITESYKKVADTYIEMFTRGREVAINLLDSKLLLFFKGGYERADQCGMGETEFGFAPSGNVYPCERLVGEDTDEQMRMGNVHTGIHLLKRCSIGKSCGSSNPECTDCSVQKYCMNWCGCTNYHMTGSAEKTGPMMCHSERSAISAAKHAFESLQNNPLFLNHIFNYASRDLQIQQKEATDIQH